MPTLFKLLNHFYIFKLINQLSNKKVGIKLWGEEMTVFTFSFYPFAVDQQFKLAKKDYLIGKMTENFSESTVGEIK